MASKKKQANEARRVAAADAVFRAESRSFVHDTLVQEGPARSVPSDMRALARQIEHHSYGDRPCRCRDCEQGRQLLSKGMPTGSMTDRNGLSDARHLRKDLDKPLWA